MLTPGNKRRFRQLFEAALNLGMREDHAAFYATEALKCELESGSWMIAPESAEAWLNDHA
jgi:hypothetical protein